jgi:aerobic-type carbon monoxide dehydrogenase small subunit (CoxS/CutS family)
MRECDRVSRKLDICLTVNGQRRSCAADTRMTFADLLRDDMGLTGTHVGCEHGVCGACTIIVDGKAVRSCLMLAPQADGTSVVTVEGLSEPDGSLGPLQRAFRKHHALQCGFCTPGILTTAHALLLQEPGASEERVREVLSGNICRCTGYVTIVQAILDARESYSRRKGVHE